MLELMRGIMLNVVMQLEHAKDMVTKERGKQF